MMLSYLMSTLNTSFNIAQKYIYKKTGVRTFSISKKGLALTKTSKKQSIDWVSLTRCLLAATSFGKADSLKRKSLIITKNLAFSEWEEPLLGQSASDSHDRQNHTLRLIALGNSMLLYYQSWTTGQFLIPLQMIVNDCISS